MKLTKFAFGIRFCKGFHVEDQFGAIVDEILYSKDSKFNEKLFPELQRANGARRLINTNQNCHLTISSTDIILEYQVKYDFKKEFEEFLTEFEDRILKKVFKAYKINNILRFGFIVGAELSEEDELLKSISQVIHTNYEEVPNDSISLRFNIVQKKPLKIGKEVTQDFDNTIITYDKEKKDSKLIFAVDYQKFFNPSLDSIDDAPINYASFCKKCYESFNKKYGTKQ
ncbi:MAG: hypothetical protein IKA45_01880 [Bacteroidales bacterium]|nr:hypothetical protein [Bacteroidales bacterium]